MTPYSAELNPKTLDNLTEKAKKMIPIFPPFRKHIHTHIPKDPETELSKILNSESQTCGQCDHFDSHNRCKKRNILVCLDTPRCRDQFKPHQAPDPEPKKPGVCLTCEHLDQWGVCKRIQYLVANDYTCPDYSRNTPKSLNPAPPEAKPTPGRVEEQPRPPERPLARRQTGPGETPL